jgi:hypothetical protein
VTVIAVRAVVVVVMGVVVQVLVFAGDGTRSVKPPEVAVRPSVRVVVDEIPVSVQHTGARAAHG